ncbi:MAG: metallophosphoesterase [Bacteroidetes bacterium]|nr:metallophosphoesterase [Bacteroidota bacterium]
MTGNEIIAVIGDVHGCLYTLHRLFGELSARTSVFYSVGDIVDRGKYPKDAVQFCIDNNIKCVRGNHEDILLRAVAESDKKYNHTGFSNFDVSMSLGGKATVYSYLRQLKTSLPPAFSPDSFDKSLFAEFKKNFPHFIDEISSLGHLDFIKSFPFKYEFPGLVITHAGIVIDEKNGFLKKDFPHDRKQKESAAGKYNSTETAGARQENLDSADEYSMMWNRDIPSDIGRFQVFGHTPVAEPEYIKNKYIDIDTGCVYGNKLTAVLINPLDGSISDIISVPFDQRDR